MRRPRRTQPLAFLTQALVFETPNPGHLFLPRPNPPPPPRTTLAVLPSLFLWTRARGNPEISSSAGTFSYAGRGSRILLPARFFRAPVPISPPLQTPPTTPPRN